MKISIITVAYEAAHIILNALESVADQSYDNIEHIVIDGGSSDGTVPLVKSYKHVTHLVSEPDQGIYDALNKGLKLASGDYIGVLHADDVYADDRVLEDVARTLKEERPDLLHGNIKYVDLQGRIVRNWKSSKSTRLKWKWGWMVPHTGLFVAKTSYEKYGSYRLDMGTAGDYECMLRLFVKYDLDSHYVNRDITKMRQGGASNVSYAARLKANAMDRKAWKVNELKPVPFIRVLKPLRKLRQFIS